MKAWRKLKPDPDLIRKIKESVELHKKTFNWQKDKGQYIPHPATFLNGGRWKDEVNLEEGFGKTRGYRMSTKDKLRQREEDEHGQE